MLNARCKNSYLLYLYSDPVISEIDCLWEYGCWEYNMCYAVLYGSVCVHSPSGPMSHHNPTAYLLGQKYDYFLDEMHVFPWQRFLFVGLIGEVLC